MQLVFIFAIVLREVYLIDLFEVMQVIWTFRVYAFMDEELFPLFFPCKGMGAVRAPERVRL